MNKPIKGSEVVVAEAAKLPALITEAARHLASATSAAEVLEAREMVGRIIKRAKRAGQVAKAQKGAARVREAQQAYDVIYRATLRAQADAMDIESKAKAKLTEEYDAAQERGEVKKPGQPRKSKVQNSDHTPGVADLGLTKQQLSEGRQIGEALKKDPDIIKRTFEEALGLGHEPTRTMITEAVQEVLAKPIKSKKTSRKNPDYKPNPNFSAALTISHNCEQIVSTINTHGHAFIFKGFVYDGAREEHRETVEMTIKILTEHLEALDGIEAGTATEECGTN